MALCADATLLDALRGALPEGWSLTAATSLEAVGEFQDVLLHRFMLVDLDEHAAFDPLEIVAEVRSEMMLNVPIFCFGGERAQRDTARLARADRFFERAEIAAVLPRLCEQFGW